MTASRSWQEVVSEMASTVTERPIALSALPPNVGNASLAGALRSEFTKIRSVRSTYWTLLGMIVVSIGFGILASYAATRNNQGPGFDPTAQSLGGLYISQLIIAALGVLVITSEYSTRMIGTTLTALPRRGTVIAAKMIVFAVVAFVSSLIICFASFWAGQAIMSSHHIGTTLSQPGVLRAVIGGALFLTACGLLAFGIGLLLRHTAGAISTVVALLFVVSILIHLLPDTWQVHVDKWMPAIAGSQIWSVVPSAGRFPNFAPWTGFAVLCGYAAIAIAAGVILFRRRNA
jgi:ABC-2 type transport system permease protein